MDARSLINPNVCRFCLKKSRYMIPVNFFIKENFQELMNEELYENPEFPQNSCRSCEAELTKFVSWKAEIRSNQTQLLDALNSDVKVEAIPLDMIKVEHNDIDDLFESTFNQVFQPEVKEEEFEEFLQSDNGVESDEKVTKRKTKTKRRKRSKFGFRNRTEEPYCCDLCGFSSKLKRYLTQHMAYHSKKKLPGDVRVPCSVCNRLVKKYYYANHMKIVHGKKKARSKTADSEHICEHCGLTLKNNLRYTYHIQAKHTKEKSLKCEFCGAAFSNRPSYLNHLNLQHFNQTATCEICTKVFKNQSYLKTHLKHVHSPATFECKAEGCKMRFTSKLRLKCHSSVHSNYRKYSCKICNSSYKIPNGLVTHIRSVHMKPIYSCEVAGCVCSYNRKDFLRAHIKSVHKDLSEDEREGMFKRLREIPLPSLENYHKLGTNSNLSLNDL